MKGFFDVDDDFLINRDGMQDLEAELKEHLPNNSLL